MRLMRQQLHEGPHPDVDKGCTASDSVYLPVWQQVRILHERPDCRLGVVMRCIISIVFTITPIVVDGGYGDKDQVL